MKPEDFKSGFRHYKDSYTPDNKRPNVVSYFILERFDAFLFTLAETEIVEILVRLQDWMELLNVNSEWVKEWLDSKTIGDESKYLTDVEYTSPHGIKTIVFSSYPRSRTRYEFRFTWEPAVECSHVFVDDVFDEINMTQSKRCLYCPAKG